ncbi:MAG: excinuclease ABC subunit UvrC [Defluviitaleaceae bacterium]|nr:excinuclease ABC subunit UvrC [Defluviitaleaceae bacterium]MCL2263345.1 excinuclease ABC subunit UvrC [Defluviitaleaceae bacterium]
MKDENDAIIYVGKAVNLQNRVRSYFQKSQSNLKTVQLAKNIHRFEYVVTDTENEAYILENNLIKLHRPKYNIRLKDDKAYPYIKITRERLPRILFSHRRGKDKAKYFGPFVSKSHVRELIDLIHRLWPLRRCSKIFPRDFEKSRPCLNNHIGQCKAPCNRLLDEETYNKFVGEAELFIQGKDTNVLQRITKEMTEAAEAMEFERAAELRDTINALKLLTEKQKVETGDEDRDVIAIARENEEALMQVFFVRGGKLSGREHYIMAAREDENNAEILSAFIKQFYSEAAFIPKEITVVSAPAEAESISAWLSGLAGRLVAILVPQKGAKHQMVKLAQTNAELTIQQFGSQIKKENERNENALKDLSTALNIFVLARIEAYDISNIQGYESVGSMIVFENGKAKNSDYRKFRLRAVIGPDDYAGMEEVLSRRFKRYNENSESFSKLPDIIFVDGGKGQISAAEKALQEQGISIPVCGMVKDDRHRTRGLLYNNEEINIPRHGEGFKLVTRIQDEVHRFALEYHKKLRANSQVKSILDEIPGIGATRRKELLKHFKNIEAIRTASIETLANAPAMNIKAAQAVIKFFNEENAKCQQQ